MAVVGAESRASSFLMKTVFLTPITYFIYSFQSCFGFVFISHMENGTNIRGAGFSLESPSADET